MLPVIIKTNSGRLLRLVDVSSINTRSIDTPSFVETDIKNSEVLLVLPGSSEPMSKYSIQGLTIEVGNTSGRIYHIVGLQSRLSDQDIDTITNSLGSGKSLRFKTNIKSSLQLLNVIHIGA